MRFVSPPLLVVFLATLLLATLLPAARPAPAAAQSPRGESFGSAVPCLTAEPSFATTCFADTFFHAAPASDPALVQVGLSSKAALAPLGSRAGRPMSAAVRDGIGSVYGLAYDDGSASGERRLFAAAYTRRLTSFGAGGPGGVYAYSFTSGSWSATPIIVVPGAGWQRSNASDQFDVEALGRVGRSGLGDIEVSPDGRELLIVNIAANRIERYDLTVNPPLRRTAITLDDGVLNNNDALDAVWARWRGGQSYREQQERAARAETVAFALEFSPVVGAEGPKLMLGLTDTMARAVQAGGEAAPSGYPALHVVSYLLEATGPQPWQLELTQALSEPGIADRMAGSFIGELWNAADLPERRTPYRERGLRGWNPWHENLASMPQTNLGGLGRTLFYPQPLLTDIELSDDGSQLFLGLRDRTGDMVLSAEAPDGQFSAVAQGDTLAYRFAGGWALQPSGRGSDPVNLRAAGEQVRPAASDYFNDNLHSYAPNSAPAHIENHGGAAASFPVGPAGGAELLAITSLFGERQSGIGFFDRNGGGWTAGRATLITPSPYAGGKAANLGDLEPLCTYAFIQGRVWDDRDGDGRQDDGEPPIGGVTLELFFGDPLGPRVAAARSDAEGRYRFAVPPNRPFRVRVATAEFMPGLGRLAGYRLSPGRQSGVPDTLNSDAAQAWGFVEFAGSRAAPSGGESDQALTPPLREQELKHIDIGLTALPATGVVGDRVWLDADRDGLQDGGELGLPDDVMRGLTITLQPHPTQIVPAALPAVERLGNGLYRFNGVPPGRYRVLFGAVPSGYTVSPYRVGGGLNDAFDSDAEPNGGMATRYITLVDRPPNAAEGNDRLDLGLISGLTDVAVELAAPTVVLVGQSLEYAVTARNLSAGSAAADVVLEHELPAGTTLDNVSGGAVVNGQRLRWSLGTLAPGQVRSFRVRVVAPMNGDPYGEFLLSSVARVQTSSTESTTANNRAATTTVLVQPAVRITKAAPATVLAGDELIYTLSFVNLGNAVAAGVAISDPLPTGLTWSRFLINPGGACSYNPQARQVACGFNLLFPGNSGEVQFAVRVDGSSATDLLVNTATIATSTVGDDPSDNSASASTAVLRANPGVSVAIAPQPFPVGTSGEIVVRYGNGLSSPATGEARRATVSLEVGEAPVSWGTLPQGCQARVDGRRVDCGLGSLSPGARGTLRFPIALPADHPADRLQAVATIASDAPERLSETSDNQATAEVDVVRPNVYLDANGPSAIVGRGSVFWYTIDYGNSYRARPALTRAAEGVVLRVDLPPQVELVQASLAPTRQEGSALTWELGTLPAGATGQLVLVVRTAVDAGAELRLDGAISTTTLGDNPADNRDRVLTEVVQPPAEIPQVGGELQLAVRSELDPNSQDGRPDNAVYLTRGARFNWPAGETLDFTPRLTRLLIPDEANLPYPYAYRARVVGWSLRAVTVNSRERNPSQADDGGRGGCRAGVGPAGAPRLLEGCRYGYLDGATLEAIRRASLPSESDLDGQARIYWSGPPVPPLPAAIYRYSVDPLGPVRLQVQVEVELQIVNAAPGSIEGIPLPEVPVVPLPDPAPRLVSGTFEVTLLAPRSVIGPEPR